MKIAKPGVIGGLLGAGLGAAGGAIADGGDGAGKGALLGGLAGAAALTRLMASLLFGTSPLDPTTYALVSLGLVSIAALASYVPARGAAHVDPAIVLRGE